MEASAIDVRAEYLERNREPTRVSEECPLDRVDAVADVEELGDVLPPEDEGLRTCWQ